jgi:transcriptional regulator with PAS, ATPase and Fis domain
MPRRPPPTSDLLLRALADLAGAAIVLDAELRTVAATPEAEALFEQPIPVGVAAPKLLCGDAAERPVAEALAAGLPVSATVPRLRAAGGERGLRVRAVPLSGAGWLLLLDEDYVDPVAGDAPLLFHGMWTRDPAMKRLFRLIEKVAAGDTGVLVRGETGSGKELVARAIHALSPRAGRPFRALNCAALPAPLLESELFGHVRGAFTGAVRDNPGHLRQAAGGTLFLDEIAELPLELQAKLLRALETHAVTPVGGGEPVPVDVRIVAATHRSLRAEVAAGRFRPDLMYRVRVVPLFLPPLRARRGDVLLLAGKIIEELSARGRRRVERVARGAAAALEAYAWPGNVRELRNALEYAFAVGDGPVLVEADLLPEILGVSPEDAAPRANVPPPTEESEAGRIRRALERSGGSRERAARALGVSRPTLWRRMKALGIV